MKELTKADRYALGLMPDGWFYAGDLSYLVSRAEYRCDRLHKMGCLEWRVGYDLGYPKSQYRKPQPARAGEEGE